MISWKDDSVLYFYKKIKVGGSANFGTLSRRYISDVTLCKNIQYFKYVLKIKYIPQIWRIKQTEWIKWKNTDFEILEWMFYKFMTKNRKLVENIVGTGGSELYTFKKHQKYVMDKFIEFLESLPNPIRVEYYTQIELQELNEQFENNYRNRYSPSTNINKFLEEMENDNMFEEEEEFEDRPYQTEYIDKGLEELLKNHRCLIDLATGGGKTRISYKIIEKICAITNIDLTVIFSPRILLNKQNTSKKYTRSYDVYNWNDDNRDFIKWVTNKSIKNKLLTLCDNSDKIVFGKIKDLNLNMFMWFDEAHFWWWNKKEVDFTDSDKFWLQSANKYRLFTTATPYEDMKNDDIYGKHIRLITPRQLINKKYLCGIEPYFFNIVNETNKYSLVDAIIYTFNRGNKKALSYHKDQQNCISLFKQFYKSFNTGKTNIKPYLFISNDNEVTKQITDVDIGFNINYPFNNEEDFRLNKNPCVLIVCRKLSFGYDNKDIDLIVFSDPKFSKSDINQCIGRGLRSDTLNIDGTNKYKILTILLPFGDDIDIDNENNSYYNIFNILRCLIEEFEFTPKELLFNMSNSSGRNREIKNYDGSSIETKLFDKLYSKYYNINFVIRNENSRLIKTDNFFNMINNGELILTKHKIDEFLGKNKLDNLYKYDIENIKIENILDSKFLKIMDNHYYNNQSDYINSCNLNGITYDNYQTQFRVDTKLHPTYLNDIGFRTFLHPQLLDNNIDVDF